MPSYRNASDRAVLNFPQSSLPHEQLRTIMMLLCSDSKVDPSIYIKFHSRSGFAAYGLLQLMLARSRTVDGIIDLLHVSMT